MYAHIIRYKGRGAWVIGMPLLIGLLLFIFTSVLNVNDTYNRDISLLASCLLLLLIDNKPTVIDDGVIQKTGKRQTGIHTFMWIEMRYWAIFWGVLGVVLLVMTRTK